VQLPSAFVGYRILHISDLHFNGDANAAKNLINAISKLEYDLCVLTGDYRFRSFGSVEMAMKGLEALMHAVNRPCVGILGNHDSLYMVPEMEAMGMSVLINEHHTVSKCGQNLILVGVDDPSYYRTHDLHKASPTPAANEKLCTILLAHSPDLYRAAYDKGLGAYLCGHTHGGQICLPGGFPILSNTRAPRWCVAGKWCYQGMYGYTSVGVGCSIVEARFFCPPEIAVHELVLAQ